MMNRDYQILLFLDDDKSISNTIYEVNNTLTSLGLILSKSKSLLLNNPEMDYEFDPSDIDNIEEAIIKLDEWPLLGSLDYYYENECILVSF